MPIPNLSRRSGESDEQYIRRMNHNASSRACNAAKRRQKSQAQAQAQFQVQQNQQQDHVLDDDDDDDDLNQGDEADLSRDGFGEADDQYEETEVDHRYCTHPGGGAHVQGINWTPINQCTSYVAVNQIVSRSASPEISSAETVQDLVETSPVHNHRKRFRNTVDVVSNNSILFQNSPGIFKQDLVKMPPRKSDVANKTGDEGTPAKESKVADGVNIEDLNLPKSIVTRLAKASLPPGTQIQGNAMLALSKGATVFVNYLANAANGDALNSGKKTITPQNVFAGLKETEFGHFIPFLEASLEKYNENQTDKRNKSKAKAADKATDVVEDTEGDRATKKARLDEEGRTDTGELAEGEVMDEDVPDEEEAGEEDDDDADAPEEEEEADVQEDADEAQEEEDEALDNGEDSD